jgi:hypothetical protein
LVTADNKQQRRRNAEYARTCSGMVRKPDWSLFAAPSRGLLAREYSRVTAYPEVIPRGNRRTAMTPCLGVRFRLPLGYFSSPTALRTAMFGLLTTGKDGDPTTLAHFSLLIVHFVNSSLCEQLKALSGRLQGKYHAMAFIASPGPRPVRSAVMGRFSIWDIRIILQPIAPRRILTRLI